MTEIMSNSKSVEDAFRTADLANSDTRKIYTQMIDAKFPQVKNKEQLLDELQKLTNHPDFSKLNDANKTLAKLSLLIENGVDIKTIQANYKLSKDMSDRLNDIQFTLHGDGDIDIQRQSAAALYRSGDYETFKILNDINHTKNLSVEDLAQMDDLYKRAVANGNLLVKHTNITNPNAIPKQQITIDYVDMATHKGLGPRTFNVRVLNLHDENVLNNLEKYGFEPGTTADDLRLTVHMVPDVGNIEKDILNNDNILLSASISDGENDLFAHQNAGVVLDYKQGSVGITSPDNAGTGFHKNRDGFAKHRSTEFTGPDLRFVRTQFIKKMTDAGIDFTLEDYNTLANMFKGVNLTHSQILAKAQNGMITINGKNFSAEQIEKFLQEATDDLIQLPSNRGYWQADWNFGFNELTVYNPEIKAFYVRGKSINSIPQAYLELSEKYNIPIILHGKRGAKRLYKQPASKSEQDIEWMKKALES